MMKIYYSKMIYPFLSSRNQVFFLFAIHLNICGYTVYKSVFSKICGGNEIDGADVT